MDTLRGFIHHDTGVVRQNDRGEELLDGRGLEVPAGMRRPTLLHEQVERLFRKSMEEYRSALQPESFAEAENLEIEEDFDEWSPYEVTEFNGIEVTAHDFIDGSERGVQRREAIKQAYLAAERNAERAEAFQAHVDDLFKKARERSRASETPLTSGDRTAQDDSQAEPKPTP